MLLTDINTLRIYKEIAWLTVKSVGTWRKETAEVLRTDFLTLFAELKCWYASTTVTFYNIRCWSMEYVSRDTCQDRFVNFTADTDRPPIINNYLANQMKVTPFCSTITRITDTFSKHRYSNEFTSTNKFTKICSNNITDNCTWLEFSTMRNSSTRILRR